MFDKISPKLFAMLVGVSVGALIFFAGRNKEAPFSAKLISVQNINKSVKYILYWSPYWDVKDYYYGYGFHPFKNCEYKNCYATDNRTFIPLEQYDALLFHATYDKKKHGVPWVRNSNQRYILLHMESPINTPNLRQYDGYFNWTMSYRQNSDIVQRYGYIIQNKTNYVIPSPSSAVIRSKKKMAAWFVSHCKTSSKRELFVNQLQKFIHVDVYGGCGKLKCPRSSPNCYEIVERDYKFYLSFENSFCQEYVTEKLYNLLQKDIVPVVYGGNDYNATEPPHSVINAANFQSAEELTSYLKFLDNNDTEFVKYFEWKTDYSVSTSPLLSACQICRKLNEPLQHKTWHDLHGWWWGVNNSMCKTGRDLPKIVSSLL